MSSRAIKKLAGQSLEDELKQLELKAQAQAKQKSKSKSKSPEIDDQDLQEEGKGDEEEQEQPKSKFNAFAFLEGDEEEGKGDEEEQEQVKSKFNAFAFLEGDEEESESEKEENGINQREPIENPPTPEKKPVASKKQKKKQKKKKSSSSPNKKIQPQGEVDQAEKDDKDDEELDRILAEFKIKEDKKHAARHQGIDEFDFEQEYDEVDIPQDFYDSNFKNFTTNRLKQCLPLLSFKSVKNLDPDQEYKNLFGNSLSMDLIDDANTTTSLAISPEVLAQFRKLAKMTRNWGGKDRRNVPGTSRKLLLSKIRDDWLPTQLKSVTMEELTDENDILNVFMYKEDDISESDMEAKIENEKALGVRYFKFNKASDSKTRFANSKFYASTVLTPDPESLMQLLQVNPYHHETLLQVAMVLLRQGDNKATSNALVERALFTFDRGFHRVFHELMSSAENGLIRLPYEFFSNRQFYLNLFRYIVSLGERSLFSTALAYCKFMLSLSPAEDPLGVRYFMDFYAIMSEEYEYLIQFRNSPLVTSYTRWYTPGIAFSTALAYLNLDKVDEAKRELMNAAKAYPYVAYKILTEVALCNSSNLKGLDFKTNHEILVSAETYLLRAKPLWQSHLQFLSANLEKFFSERPQMKDSSGFVKSFMGLFSGKSEEKSAADSKEVPINLVRFAILSGENKIMGKLPQAVWSREDILEYDLLPPRDHDTGELTFGTTQNRRALVCDSLLDHVDQRILGTIVQENTRGNADVLTEEELEIMRNLLRNAVERGEANNNDNNNNNNNDGDGDD
ncbi:uncharacterized protein LODBEIA_P37150 [Lodderomyces beijingensis]|uniref:Ribosome quality control complex subunit 1 n=1 Tax=Lodderomyces beijingensis TaxID=1775926 RepID=A0ABP0ZMX4_9ASCO